MSLSGRQWVVVLALSLIAPAVVGVDKAIQLSRQRQATASESKEAIAEPALQASA
jgi:P-type Ca2+ transporter type 2C